MEVYWSLLIPGGLMVGVAVVAIFLLIRQQHQRQTHQHTLEKESNESQDI